MGYRTLKSCIDDLRRTGQLIEFHEEVDPYLELAAVQRLACTRCPKYIILRRYRTAITGLRQKSV